jgi:outer membrane immunogenic protein
MRTQIMTKNLKTIAAAALALTLSMAPAMANSHCAAQRWAGLYGGVNVGAAQYMVSRNDLSGNAAPFGVPPIQTPFGTGLTGGGQVGYSAVRCNTIIGIEVDYNLARSKSDYTSPFGGGVHTGSSLTSFGTARIRGGIALDQSLFYLTGGLAFGETEHGINYKDPFLQSILAWNDKGTRTGWTVGAGIGMNRVDSRQNEPG